MNLPVSCVHGQANTRGSEGVSNGEAAAPQVKLNTYCYHAK
jgi:hypothetical protein